MTFRVIKGTYKPGAGTPDGDSVRFAPDDPSTLFELPRRGRALRLNQNNGTIQLRFEGIDAPEKEAITAYSTTATERNLELLGLANDEDESRGYILSNQVGPNGRPICFVYAGNTEAEDGSELFLDSESMVDSVNFQLLQEGYVYPLFYDTLYQDLRQTLALAVAAAREVNAGLWPVDASLAGIEWEGARSLASMPPIFPKLWRRLERYTQDRDYRDVADTLAEFTSFLAEQSDRLVIISSARATDLEDILDIEGNRIRLTVDPVDLFFIS